MQNSQRGTCGIWWMRVLVLLLVVATTAVVGFEANAAVKKAVAKQKVPVPARTRPWGSRIELGLYGGWLGLDEVTGLGNAFHVDNIPLSAPMFGLRLGYTITPEWAAEIEFDGASSKFKREGRGNATLFGYRGLARYTLMPNQTFSPFFTLGIGQRALFRETEALRVDQATMEELDEAQCQAKGTGCQIFQVIKGGEADDGIKDGDRDVFWQLGVGATYDITWRLSARMDLRWVPSDARPAPAGESSSSMSNNFEAVVGLTWGFGGPADDSDGDGIDDDHDKCLDRAEDRDGFEDKDGCPDVDNDGDGVLDADDSCPNKAEDKDGFKDKDGCPDVDNDKDGIADKADKCPNKAEDKDGFRDKDGCPDLDNDKDGIADKADKCPNKVEDKDGFEDKDGCPELDNDKDGIVDKSDKCPNKPETRNGFKDKDGCPDDMPAHIAPLFSGPAKGVVFKGKKLGKTALPTLEKLLELMLEQDDVKIVVHVHAAGRGKPAKWQKVSKQRGGTIQAFFNEAGIDPSRFIVKAWGDTKPRVKGTGRKANRANNYVQFKVYDATQK